MANLAPVPTDDTVYVGLRALLLNLFPSIDPKNILQGQQNDVPMPVGPDFILMIPEGRKPLATTIRDYNGVYTRTTTRSTRFDIMVNFYGPSSPDLMQVFMTLFRDLYGCDFLKPYGIQPLWNDDGNQMPLVDGEQQYEQRWMVRTALQANPAVSTSQDFADKVSVTLVEAD